MPTSTSETGAEVPNSAAAPGEASSKNDFWAELQKAQQLASSVSDWGSNMFGLAWLEFQLAAKSVPQMLGLGLALIPILKFTWLSFSVLLAWLAYDASGVVAVGLGTLLGLQILLLLVCLLQIKRLKKRSSFRETRQQWQLFVEELRTRPEATADENAPSNRH